ncbi:MarR family winged helix-turn-helix transcriptional regulator [Furfurilactobacillus entadae]|uniref:MarR family winged helix-turn-helix transcriptional regulator n=1 Tax=Furfurilactobacillus entadae TaxID=2922307 RepID=UPI0035EACE65
MIDELRRLGTFSRRATTSANHAFAAQGLNNNRFQYLLRICERPGLFFDELATDMAVDRTTSFRAVQKLITEGYVEKRADAVNKKVRRLYPTAQAQALYPSIHAFERGVAERTIGSLTPGEQQLLAELLTKINKQL